jgi:hypothetical protein
MRPLDHSQCAPFSACFVGIHDRLPRTTSPPKFAARQPIRRGIW